MMKLLLPVLTFLLASTTSQAADTCEPLRARIEANIAGKGLTDFTVIVVDANANATGEVVGSCDNGAKKIVYAKDDAAVAVPPKTANPAIRAESRPAPARKTPDEKILTECKDGTVTMGGYCKP